MNETPVVAPAAPARSALLGATAFIVGAGVMIIEMTASRILAPHYGASLFVWTSIIVTVLLALSVGYWLGGVIAERGGGLSALAALLYGAAFLLVTGTALITVLIGSVAGVFSGWTAAVPVLFVGSLLSSFLVFALPVLLLAMAGPVVLKEWSAAGGDIGRTAGRYFAVSTMGSVLGTVLPSLVLVPRFGTRLTILGVASAFVLCALVVRPPVGRQRWLASLVLLPLSALLLPTVPAPANTVYERESPYQYLRVEVDPLTDRRNLIFNEGLGVQSVWTPGAQRTGLYYDHFAGVPLLHSVDGPREALMLGLAGGTGVRQYLTGAEAVGGASMTGVEIDAEVVRAARDWFDIDELPLDVVTMDGRAYLASTDRTFDDVIVDAYSVQLYIAPHLATEEFFALVRSRLKEGGVMAMNVNAASEDSPLLVSLLDTVASQFRTVLQFPVGHWNRLVLASDGTIDVAAAQAMLPAGYEDVGADYLLAALHERDASRRTFTDDRAPIELMTDKMVVEAALSRSMGSE